MVVRLEDVERRPLSPIRLGSETEAAPHTKEYNESDATKMHLALGQDSPGVPSLTSMISSGNADTYRRLIADKDRIEQQNRKSDILQSIMEVKPDMIDTALVETVQGLSIMELDDPDVETIVARKYSKLYADMTAASLDNQILEEAVAADEEASLDVIDRSESLILRQNFVHEKLDELRKENEDRGIFSKAWDFTERIIPFVEAWQTHDAIEEAADWTSSILPGNNRQEQYAYMWNLSDPREFRSTLTQVYEDLKGRNLYVAQAWLEGLFSYGNSDANIDNIFAIADAASLIPVKSLATAMKGAIRAGTKSPTKIPEIAAALGKNQDAAVGKVIEDISSDSFFGNIRRAKDLENSVPSISSPDKMMTGADNISQASYTRLKEALLARGELAHRFLTEPNLVDRLAPEELVQYKNILFDDYVKANPSIQKNVIDVSINPETDIGNVYTATISLGKRDGSLFESEQAARTYFNRWIKGTDDFRIEQVGQGYQIKIDKTVNEAKIATDLTLGTSQRSPETISTIFDASRWVRSADYLVSREQVLARSTAVTSHELMKEIVSEMAKPFKNLSKKEFNELEDIMIHNRQKQTFYENFGEFTQAFQDRFHRLPSDNQVDTYFAYVQLNDLDLIVRDLDWYRQKARLGLEEISVRLNDIDEASGVSTPISANFEGKVIDRLPFGSKDQFSVSVIKDGQASKPVSSRFITSAKKAEYQKLLDEGYKIVQVADQNFKVGDRSAGFLLVKDFSRNRIGLKNVDRKPGGHKVHQYPIYIKQGRISRGTDEAFYRGDKTLFGARTEGEAREIVDALNEARLKVLNKSPDAETFIRDKLPEVTARRFMKAVEDGDIDLQTPFAVTRRGIRTVDTGVYQDIQNLHDVSKNEHNLASQVTGRFGGERDKNNIDILQSEGDVMFDVETAPYLSPLQTLRMSTNNMLSTRGLNDYTALTHRNFIREFSDILEGTREEQLSKGLGILSNPTFKSGTDPRRVNQARGVSTAYNNLMNHGSKYDRAIEGFKENLLRSTVGKFGPRGEQWVADRQLTRTTDPGTFFRSVAFHTKLGLFNPLQYFVQANSMVNVASIAGLDGLKAAASYPIFRSALLSNSPKIWEKAGAMAQTLGLMKKDEFLESMALFRKSGFNSIGGDVASLDVLSSPEISLRGPRAFLEGALEKGTTPFKEGERMVRVSAWNAAYLERKKALRGGKITRRDEAMILQRAKDLTGNMTRESNATWQKGYSAVFTQFFGYQARIMEQFLGKKLTMAEKARLFTGYSAVYGIPVASGAVAGVIPVRDIVMEYLFDQGIDPDEEAWEPLVDGFASGFLEMIFGSELNVASRYGPGGLPTFYDLWRGDKELGDILLGASGSIIGQGTSDVWTLGKKMASEYMDFEGGTLNLTPEDMVRPFRNISTVDNAIKLYQVWNLGIWASKNGTNLIEMDLPDGLMAALTGLQPSAIEDGFMKLRSTQDFQEHLKSVQKEMIKEYRQVMKMDPGPERSLMVKNIKARMVLEGMPLRMQAQTWKYAADQEMVTDVFFEKYEDLPARKAAKENQGG